MKFSFIERNDSSEMILNFLLSAIFTVLATRLYFKVMNNPMIAFGQWHFSHVLWGGLGMVISIFLILNFHGNNIRRLGAFFGGVGWGFFIDEIGKYVTHDYNYWFQPAIIFIYISFVFTYLLYLLFKKHQPKNSKSLLYAVISDLCQIVEKDFEKSEKKLMLKRINQVIKIETDSKTQTFAKRIKKIIILTPSVPDRKSFSIRRYFYQLSTTVYQKIFRRKLIFISLSVYSLFFAYDKIYDFTSIIFSPQKMIAIERFYKNYDFFSRTDTYMIGFKILFDVLSSLLFIVGWYFLSRKKISHSLNFFQYGLLINIFLSSIFKFYFEQFSAVFVLGFNILIFQWLKLLKLEFNGRI